VGRDYEEDMELSSFRVEFLEKIKNSSKKIIFNPYGESASYSSV